MFDSRITELTPIEDINTNPYQRIYQSLYRKGLKNIDSATFGGAESPSNPEDLILKDTNEYDYEDVILYLRNEISRLRKFIGFDQIDTNDQGETGSYELKANDYDFVFGYRENDKITTKDEMTCLLDYIKQFSNTVKVYEGILYPESVDIDFETGFDWTV